MNFYFYCSWKRSASKQIKLNEICVQFKCISQTKIIMNLLKKLFIDRFVTKVGFCSCFRAQISSRTRYETHSVWNTWASPEQRLEELQCLKSSALLLYISQGCDSHKLDLIRYPPSLADVVLLQQLHTDSQLKWCRKTRCWAVWSDAGFFVLFFLQRKSARWL